MRTSLNFERIYPSLFSVLAFTIGWHFQGTLPEGREGVLSSTISIGAIATGFLGTLKGILMTLPQPTMEMLKAGEYLDDLARYLTEALISSMGISATGLIGYFSVYENHKSIFFCFWLASLFYGALCTYRVSSILMLILKDQNK